MEAFCIEDTKSEDHGVPFFCENQAVAMRLLRKPCNDPEHTWCKYSTDFHLFKVGDWDSTLAEIVGHPKKHITSLEALVEKPSDGQQFMSIAGGE